MPSFFCAGLQRRRIDCDVGLALAFVFDLIRRNDARITEHYLLSFRPLAQCHPRPLIIRVRDNRVDKLFFSFAGPPLRDQVIAPKSIGGLAVGIDLDLADEPLIGLLVVLVLEVNVTVSSV